MSRIVSDVFVHDLVEEWTPRVASFASLDADEVEGRDRGPLW
jgi:hypothetical protein